MTISPAYPDILQNGTPADATQVMADFYQIQNDVNANAAANGANSDITSLSGLTTPLSIGQGGTGATAGSAALTGLGALAVANNLSDVANPVIALSNIYPSGVVHPYAGTSAPSGWLLCYGQLVSTTTYANLYAAIGTTYGSGAGTFGLPDLRGRSIAGLDNMGGVAANRITASSGFTSSVLGNAGGDELLYQHSHSVSDPGHAHTYSLRAASGSPSSTGPSAIGSVPMPNAVSGTSTTGISIANAGGGVSQNMSPTMLLNYIIKT